ncbi:glycosyltransferase family 2 protein [Algoriphagus sp. C2-7]|uniref:Glycosyltransferase family 2 protein n=1 Tax=Algoriphagus sediminis TaxID=3057113 RepID=A0ABT7YDW2_9BACT|nr:glycosyltransferase family 2 protein [Algoriphagus sediminis]MDN3204713.1 glycosyltransferase family 2 protein [Algoriphagus sediminis]
MSNSLNHTAVKLSIVSPVYLAENTLEELLRRIKQSVLTVTDSFEIILVDDGCPDNSWLEIERLASIHDEVLGIRLSRNFGQHYAITAGLDKAEGEWIVVMDCDLQDLPEEIPNLFRKAQEGFDVVQGRRISRKDGLLKKLSSKVFYRALSWLTGLEQDETIANFGIYHRKVIHAIIGMRESIRFFPSMVKWVGFKQTSIPVQHGANEERKSAYSFGKLARLGLDIILAYSDKPLRLTIKAGIIIAAIGFLFALYTLIKYLQGDIVVAGYASLIISIWVLTGVVLITLGMVGLYVGKTFESAKARPIYVVEKEVSKYKAKEENTNKIKF